MRRFALPIAVLAWLLSSLMPAFALSAAQDHAGHVQFFEAMPHTATVSDHRHAGSGADHHTAHEHVATKTAPACADCVDKPACAMSLCSACTSLVPDLMLSAFRPAIAERLVAFTIVPLTGMAPGPSDPPPRA